MTPEAEKLDKIIARHELGKPIIYSLEWCADRITWAWKWRKITRQEMESLADRVTRLFENGL